MGIKPIRPLMKMTTTDPFHSARKNKKGVSYPHSGEDLKADIGTPVNTILDGVVVRSFYREPKIEGDISYGNVVVIYHGESLGKKPDERIYVYSLYAHLCKRWVEVNKTVSSGGLIAESGDTGNVPPHLHFEVLKSPYKITWGKTGRKMGNYIYGQHSKDPMEFLNNRFLKIIEPLTDAESATLHSMIEIDFKGNPNPIFFVKAPPFKEVMRRIRPGTDITGIEPPIFELEFQNAFSGRFKKQYPSIALNVNGKTIDKIRPGTTNYDLNIWR